ncbi:DUF1190 domain-containing protein [Paracoccus tegillarcae]|uniref:DUF1190 domain-containing protein n=1 Tax=Paracoccus tegillarcae TaxID=1529068 RepID=A0A2K9EU52_9RHOB|nr:DUF1190 domain-containing protein [Paracoccus tegillarcae]AUH35315.1 hypothetical protein CUV01_08660 [Paracoccus tegillarcae]
MRKRSRNVSLAILGAAAFGLAGCKSEETDASAFPDEASCVAAADQGSLFFTAEDCQTAFAQAQQDHLETAPRYESLEVCEAEHGAGNCGGDPAAQESGGGGSIFMPLMMGYLLGSALSGSNRGVMSQPLSRTANGGFATPSGDTRLATNSGTGKVQPAAFNKGPTTMGQPPMTRAQVAQRGGFGQTAASRGGGTRSVGG